MHPGYILFILFLKCLCCHSCFPGSENLAELVSAVMQRIGKTDDHDHPQILVSLKIRKMYLPLLFPLYCIFPFPDITFPFYFPVCVV